MLGATLMNESTADWDNALSDKVFNEFRELIHKAAGISMSEGKKTLISGRLTKRLRFLQLLGFKDYLHYITKGEGAYNGEFQQFIDLLTTNETYFFREPQHFDFLKNTILPHYKNGRRLRIWSAASSSGEEAYTLAMILADELGLEADWKIIGTDISTKMITAARAAIYSEHRARMVPQDPRHRYLLRGKGEHSGFVAVAPELKMHVAFQHYNLVESPINNENYDVIFCRNVLIYFNQETKLKVISRLCQQLKHDGYLMTGHSESLHGVVPALKSVCPSVYHYTAKART